MLYSWVTEDGGGRQVIHKMTHPDMTEKCFLGHKESCQQTKQSFNLISGEIQPPPLLHCLGNMDDEFVPVHIGTDSLES